MQKFFVLGATAIGLTAAGCASYTERVVEKPAATTTRSTTYVTEPTPTATTVYTTPTTTTTVYR